MKSQKRVCIVDTNDLTQTMDDLQLQVLYEQWIYKYQQFLSVWRNHLDNKNKNNTNRTSTSTGNDNGIKKFDSMIDNYQYEVFLSQQMQLQMEFLNMIRIQQQQQQQYNDSCNNKNNTDSDSNHNNTTNESVYQSTTSSTITNQIPSSLSSSLMYKSYLFLQQQYDHFFHGNNSIRNSINSATQSSIRLPNDEKENNHTNLNTKMTTENATDRDIGTSHIIPSLFVSSTYDSSIVDTFFQQYPNCCKHTNATIGTNSTNRSEHNSKSDNYNNKKKNTVVDTSSQTNDKQSHHPTTKSRTKKQQQRQHLPDVDSYQLHQQQDREREPRQLHVTGNIKKIRTKKNITKDNPIIYSDDSDCKNYSKKSTSRTGTSSKRITNIPTNYNDNTINPFCTANEVVVLEESSDEDIHISSEMDVLPRTKDKNNIHQFYHSTSSSTSSLPTSTTTMNPYVQPPMVVPTMLIRESLKRKFQPPKKSTICLDNSISSNNNNHNRKKKSNESVQPYDSNQRKDCSALSKNDSRRTIRATTIVNSDMKHHTTVHTTTSSSCNNNNDDDDELPEELRIYGKELVEKIEHEIMDQNHNNDHSTTKITFQTIAGLIDQKQIIYEIVCWPMLRPDIFTGLRCTPNGLLLYGPPGTGKNLYY
jgi:hypothetical protein